MEDKSDHCAVHPLSGGILELHNNLNNTHVHILVLEKRVQTEPRGGFSFFPRVSKAVARHLDCNSPAALTDLDAAKRG